MSLELWTLIIAVVTAISCSLCGSLLVVNRQAMVSEGLSHAVLPGLALAFWILRDYNSPWLLVAAAASGLVMVWLSEAMQRTNLLDSDASLGIVFAGMFSVGILFVSNFLKQTHFHADCIIDGNLAIAALDRFEIGGWDLGPRSWMVMLLILAVQLLFIAVCYKELKASLFDPELASRFGLRPKLFQLSWLSIVSLTTVAAFNVAGSILIVALMIAPPAAAYLVTTRLHHLLLVSAIVGAASALVGFYASLSLDIAPTGPIASASGIVFLLILLCSPQNGFLATQWGRWQRNRETLECLVLQWIEDESQGRSSFPSEATEPAAKWSFILQRLKQKALIEQSGGQYALTAAGHEKLAAKLAEFSSVK
ncbi:MAG: metal ABC transporter permease [Planctomycetaceae bacterium]|nr:metal ABC transporter permease [Planctomycetaceae bacterium]